MAEHAGSQGGGKNNTNKKAKRASAVQTTLTAGRPSVFAASVKPPGGAHVVGQVPAPVEETSRPGRR